LLNRRNKEVILRKANFTTIEGRNDLTLKRLREMVGSHPRLQIVFALTEPDLSTFVPVVSANKLGNLLSVNCEEQFLEIKLRDDFMPE